MQHVASNCCSHTYHARSGRNDEELGSMSPMPRTWKPTAMTRSVAPRYLSLPSAARRQMSDMSRHKATKLGPSHGMSPRCFAGLATIATSSASIRRQIEITSYDPQGPVDDRPNGCRRTDGTGVAGLKRLENHDTTRHAATKRRDQKFRNHLASKRHSVVS